MHHHAHHKGQQQLNIRILPSLLSAQLAVDNKLFSDGIRKLGTSGTWDRKKYDVQKVLNNLLFDSFEVGLLPYMCVCVYVRERERVSKRAVFMNVFMIIHSVN